MFDLVIRCRAPFEVLHNALKQYSIICTRIHDGEDARNANNTLFSDCSLEENFLPSMLNSFRKLVEFENVHPAIWLHMTLHGGSCHRVPPVYFLFATGIRMLFTIRIPENTLANFYCRLYVHHSQLLRFFLDECPNVSRSSIGGLLAYICGKTTLNKCSPILDDNYLPFSYSSTFLSTFHSLLDDATFIEFYNQCISLCEMAYRFSASIGCRMDESRIEQFDYSFLSHIQLTHSTVSKD